MRFATKPSPPVPVRIHLSQPSRRPPNLPENLVTRGTVFPFLVFKLVGSKFGNKGGGGVCSCNTLLVQKKGLSKFILKINIKSVLYWYGPPGSTEIDKYDLKLANKRLSISRSLIVDGRGSRELTLLMTSRAWWCLLGWKHTLFVFRTTGFH